MSKFISIVSIVLLATTVFGQNESDGLLFSRSDVLGTARYTALGGAFTALGGDASASLVNPAGVAVYRNNEFSLSGTYNERFTSADYYNNITETGKGSFSFGSLSITGVQDLHQAGKWRNTAVSFGSNLKYSFRDEYAMEATGVNSSILDDYTNTLNDLGIDWYDLEEQYPFDLYLLWENLLVDVVPGESNVYYHTAGLAPKNHYYEVERSGSKRETYFNFGSNYDDKLYLGIGVQTSSVNYEKKTVYTETFDQTDSTTVLDEFSQGFYEDISGRGWSANIGIIYRPVIPLRIGFSFKTPEIQNLEYNFESDNFTISDEVLYEVISPYVIRDYRFRVTSPLQTTLGVAYTFKKYGLISVEADYVDMRSIAMRGRTDSDPFTNENRAIESLLNPTINVRSGLEYRVTPNVSARFGYAVYGNPYSDKVLGNSGFQILSLGGGYRVDQFFVDASYQYKMSSDRFTLYDPALVEPVDITNTDHRLTLTVGLML